MATLILFYFLFLGFGILLTLGIFKVFYGFMCWIAEMADGIISSI